jgi:hypothetical protein
MEKTMLTIQELEAACAASNSLDFSRHPLEAPALTLHRMFYPHGFPAQVRTNAPEIFDVFRESWGHFRKGWDTPPIQVDVHLVDDDSSVCPPTPSFRMMLPTMVNVADENNYSILHLGQDKTQITVSRAALRHTRYLRYFFLDASAVCHLVTSHVTPVHAGCVALNNCGLLLCGDSGSGKSSLSYACARAGWTFTCDDASLLLNGGKGRIVTGDCHRVRLRPAAAELFPEINELKMTPRAAGKPSIEIATRSMANIKCGSTAHVEFIVFLNRRGADTPQLVPYRKCVARNFMHQGLYGTPEMLAPQYESIERLLTADVLELRYTEIAWAVERLGTLAREGR